MVRPSNFIVGFLNCLTLLLGVVAIGSSAYIHIHGGTACQKTLEFPLLIAGLSLFVVSLLGLIGSCCQTNLLLYPYLFLMLLLIVGVFIATSFFFVASRGGFVARAVSGIGFKEYRLENYGKWFQRHLVEGKNWDKIESCLIEAQVCKSLAINGDSDRTVQDLYRKHLSSIQSGCCKPPLDCGFEYKNATFWTAPESGGAVSAQDSDCSRWSNDQNKLCYDCDSCKGGFVANIKKEWRLLAILSGGLLVFLIVVYVVGCCAKSNNQDEKPRGYSRYHPA